MSTSLVDQLLNEALANGRSSAAKKVEQSQATQEKLQEHAGRMAQENVDLYGALSAPDYGQATSSDKEKQLAYANPSDMLSTMPYDQVGGALADRSDALNQVTSDNIMESDWETRAADLVNNFGGAAIQGTLGLGHLAGMGINALTGLPIDELTGKAYDAMGEGIQEHQSPYQQAQERKYQAEMARRQRDIDSNQYDNSFDKFVDEAGATAGALFNNPEQISTMVQSGLGSLVSGGLGGSAAKAGISKAMLKTQQSSLKKDASKFIPKGATPEQAKTITDSFVKDITMKAKELGKAKDPITERTIMASITETAPYVAANAMQEAGGIGRDTYNAIINYSHEDLIRGSDEYRKRLQMGESPEEAKRNVALVASQVASASAIPLLLTANAIVGPFEAAPLKSLTAKATAELLVKSPIEESIQEGGGALVKNLAEKYYADIFKDPTQGVAQASVEGAAAGMGMVAVSKAPSIAVAPIKPAVKAVASGAKKVGQAATKKNEQRQVAKDVKQFEEVVAPELKAEEAKIVEQFKSTKFSEDELKAQGANAEAFTNLIGQATNPIVTKDTYKEAGLSEDFINKNVGEPTPKNIIQHINDLDIQRKDKNTSPEDKAILLDMMVDSIDSFNSISDLAMDGHPDLQVAVKDYADDIINKIREIPTVIKLMEEATAEYAKAKVPENITTEAPNPTVLNHLSNKMTYAPESVTAEQSTAILKHAENQGLPVAKLEALKDANVLIKAMEESIKAMPKEGTKTPAQLVKENITVQEDIGDTGKLSVKAHMDRISKAIKDGNKEDADLFIQEFSDFKEHMNNKLAALDKSLKDGKRHTFMARKPNGEWFESPKAWGVTKGNPKSMQFYANVKAETDFVNKIHDYVTNKAQPVTTPKTEANTETVAPDTTVVPEVKTESVTKQEEAGDLDFTIEESVNTVESTNTAPINDDSLDFTIETMDNNESAKFRLKQDPEVEIETDTEFTRPKTPKYIDEATSVGITTKEAEALLLDDKGNTDATESKIFESNVNNIPKVKGGEGQRIVKAMTPKMKKVFNKLSKEKKLIKGRFKNLINGTKDLTVKASNGFYKAFDITADGNSHFTFVDKPIEFITNIFKSKDNPTKAKFKDTSYFERVSDSYVNMLNTVVPQVKELLNKRLQDERLNKFLSDGKEIHRFADKQALNIAEGEAGNLKYNDQLIELAVLAGLQEVLSRDASFKDFDLGKLADSLGMQPWQITEDMINKLSQGLIESDIKGAIANRISRYWGLRYADDANIGLVKGIPEAIATEVILALSKVNTPTGDKYLNRETIQVPLEDGEGTLKTLYTYIPGDLGKDNDVYKYSNLIEETVLKEPTKKWYLNGDVPKVDTHDTLGNELTDINKNALEHSNNVSYEVNSGYKEIADLMGAAKIADIIYPETKGDLKDFNKVARESAISKRRLVSQTMDQLNNAIALSEAMGETFIVRFKHFIASEKRVHQEHPGPQSNKILRELLTAVRDVIDLTDETASKIFRSAIAQGFGLDVNKKTFNTIDGDLQDVITELRPYINRIQDWSRDKESDNIVEIYEEAMALGVIDNSMVAMHNLYEYAMSEIAPDQSKFTTSVYIEIDGITSGSALASLMFGSEINSPATVELLERGGFGLNYTDVTYNEKREHGLNDNYYALSDAIKESQVLNITPNAAPNDYRSQATNQVTQAFIDFFPKAVTEDGESGVIDTSRGFVKNLLTVLIYGSGVKGIASKYTGDLVDNMYKTINDLSINGVKSKSNAELRQLAMKFDTFNKLARTVTKRDEAGNIYFAKPISKAFKELPVNAATMRDFDFKNFVFESADLNRVTKAIQHVFAEPAREIADQVMTPALMNRMRSMGRGINYVSAVSKAIYTQYEKDLLKEKSYDPTWNVSDGLTFKEVDDLKKRVMHTMKIPTVAGGFGKLIINKMDKGKAGNAPRGRGLAGEMRTVDDSFVYGTMGVAGIALTTIGFGDARSTQSTINEMGENYKGTGVHDGTNIPINGALEFGNLVNKVTLNEMIKYEVFTDVGRYIQSVMKDLDKHIKTLDTDTFDQLTRDFFGTNDIKTEVAFRETSKAMFDIMETEIPRVEAFHKALKNTKINSNNYNGVEGTEYVSEGLYYGSEEWYKANGLKPRKEKPTKPVEATKANTAKILETLKPDDTDKFNEMVIKTSLNKGKLKNVNVTEGDIATNLKELGINDSVAEGTKGIFAITEDGKGHILLPKGASRETLAHELIHAGTYNVVSAYLTGGAKALSGISKINAESFGKAIEDIKSIRDQFITDTRNKMDDESAILAQGELDLYAQLVDSKTDDFTSIMEMMSWGLTNKDIRSTLKGKTKDANTNFWFKLDNGIKNVIKDVLSYLGIPTTQFNNIYERLAFNTLIIQQSPYNGPSGPTQGSLFHKVSDKTVEQYKQVFEALMAGKANDPLFSKAVNAAFTGIYKNVYTDKTTLIASLMSSKGVNLDTDQIYKFGLIANTLAVESDISPETMLYAQSLMTHVLETAVVEDFMDDPTSTNPGDYAKGLALYEAMTAGKEVTTDKGTSYLLPAFIALASVSPEFSKVLSKFKLPEKVKGTGTLDSIIRAKAENASSDLMRMYAGVNRHTSTINEAISGAVVNFIKESARESNVIDRASIIASRSKDWVNDSLVGLFDKTGDKLVEVGSKISNGNRATKLTGDLMQVTGRLIQDKDGEVTKSFLEKLANKESMPKFVTEFLTDLVGLSTSNDSVYKMIKKVKTNIQRLRQTAREVIPESLAKKFKTRPTKEMWHSMTRTIGNTDVGSLLNSYTYRQASSILNTDASLNKEISRIENKLKSIDPRHGTAMIRKAKELGQYLATGATSKNLLMNVDLIARLAGEGYKTAPKPLSIADKNMLDSLISLYAFRDNSFEDKSTTRKLLRNEPEAMEQLVRYANRLGLDEVTKDVEGTAGKVNRRKGWTPFIGDGRRSLVVAKHTEATELIRMGYKNVGTYDTGESYYYLDTAAKSPYHQGIMQSVRTNVSGVDDITGFGSNHNAGIITNPKAVRDLIQNPREGFIPIYFNETSAQPYAFERVMSRDKLALLQPNTNLADLLGAWKGRQLEEDVSKASNMLLADNLRLMYEDAVTRGEGDQYVDVMSESKEFDPVIRDAIKLIPRHVIDYVDNTNNGSMMVPRSMINDVLGYRMAVVGDAWTGNTRWNKETTDTFREVTQTILGDNAYRLLMKSQFLVQDLVQDARTLIVIKSVIVPAINIISNMAQLIARGVPASAILKETPKLVNEINYYTKTLRQIQEAEVERDVKLKSNPRESKDIDIRIQSMRDSLNRLSIAPLIEAGEFATVATSTTLTADNDLELGNIDSYLERAIDKLPTKAKTLGKYAIVSSDTALYQAMQKATDYGDFVAKAILYKHLTTRKNVDKQKALDIITDEYIHYDKLQGRNRHTLENIGLMWFYNWKIRATKIGISTMRNNPFHTIIAANLPMPDTFSTVGLPFEDSVLGRMLGFGSSMWNSVGWGIGMRAPTLNPWYNIIN